MWIKTYDTRDEAWEDFLNSLADADRREKLRRAYSHPAPLDYTDEGFAHSAARPVVVLEPHHD